MDVIKAFAEIKTHLNDLAKAKFRTRRDQIEKNILEIIEYIIKEKYIETVWVMTHPDDTIETRCFSKEIHAKVWQRLTNGYTIEQVTINPSNLMPRILEEIESIEAEEKALYLKLKEKYGKGE